MIVYLFKRDHWVRVDNKPKNKSIGYVLFIAIVLIVMSYLLGGMTGYAVGYNDNYVEKVVKYKKNGKLR